LEASRNQISLALSGGAARGAYHLGVLQYIDENNIEVKAISATSIGAIIGASYACGVTPKEQLAIFKSEEFKKIFSLNTFHGSLFKIDSHAKILEKLIPLKRMEEFKIPLYISAVDLENGENIYFNSGDVKEICLSSSALTPVFPPVMYQNKKLIDGGTINHMPIEPLAQYSYKLVGVNLHPVYEESVQNSMFAIFKRAVFLGTFRNSLEAKNKCDVYISSPELENYSLFSFKNLDELFALGYKNAVEIFNKTPL
jgi:NTE family protein